MRQRNQRPQKTAVVIGGGWAGLAAALRLAERGVGVELYEKRAILGGRAYSFRAREAGHAVDNGQHLLMGCYQATLRFLDRIGAQPASSDARRAHLHAPLAHRAPESRPRWPPARVSVSRGNDGERLGSA